MIDNASSKATKRTRIPTLDLVIGLIALTLGVFIFVGNFVEFAWNSVVPTLLPGPVQTGFIAGQMTQIEAFTIAGVVVWLIGLPVGFVALLAVIVIKRT